MNRESFVYQEVLMKEAPRETRQKRVKQQTISEHTLFRHHPSLRGKRRTVKG
jgi:hypothetical protein